MPHQIELPNYAIAFANSWYDLAIRALRDCDNDPTRAVGRALDLARQPEFRDVALRHFITAIAVEQVQVSEGNDPSCSETHSQIVNPPTSETSSDDVTPDHITSVTQLQAVDGTSSETTSSVEPDQVQIVTHVTSVQDSTGEAESEGDIEATLTQPAPTTPTPNDRDVIRAVRRQLCGHKMRVKGKWGQAAHGRGKARQARRAGGDAW
jgi:hypothetical protein